MSSQAFHQWHQKEWSPFKQMSTPASCTEALPVPLLALSSGFPLSGSPVTALLADPSNTFLYFTNSTSQRHPKADHSFLLKNFPFPWKQTSVALLRLLWLNTYSSFCNHLCPSPRALWAAQSKASPLLTWLTPKKRASISIKPFQAYRTDDSQVWTPGSPGTGTGLFSVPNSLPLQSLPCLSMWLRRVLAAACGVGSLFVACQLSAAALEPVAAACGPFLPGPGVEPGIPALGSMAHQGSPRPLALAVPPTWNAVLTPTLPGHLGFSVASSAKAL